MLQESEKQLQILKLEAAKDNHCALLGNCQCTFASKVLEPGPKAYFANWFDTGSVGLRPRQRMSR